MIIEENGNRRTENRCSALHAWLNGTEEEVLVFINRYIWKYEESRELVLYGIEMRIQGK